MSSPLNAVCYPGLPSIAVADAYEPHPKPSTVLVIITDIILHLDQDAPKEKRQEGYTVLPDGVWSVRDR